MFFFVVIFFLCLLTGRKFFQWSKQYNRLNNNYFCLFLGSTEDVMQKVLDLLISISSTPCNLWLGLHHYVLIDKPDDLQIILNSSNALAKSDVYRFFRRTSGEGLFGAPVEKWKEHRRIITPAFNMKLLESFFPIFNSKNQILIERLNEVAGTDKRFDAWSYIYANSLNIILETTMGFEENSDEHSKREFEKALNVTVEAEGLRVYKPWLYSDIIYTIYSYLSGLDKSYKVVHKLPMQVIKYKKKTLLAERGENLTGIDVKKDKYNRTFLDILLQLNEEGANFSDQDIRDETVTMMIAGSETSALTISFTLLMLAMHPDVQEKVHQEISEIIGYEDRFIELSDLKRMTYLEQCIKETLRLFPIGPVFSRTTKGPIKLTEGFIIPAHTNIIIPPIKVHRNPDMYSENATVWNPDNFTLEEIEKRHKFSFIPFSMGPRGCIGQTFIGRAIALLKRTRRGSRSNCNSVIGAKYAMLSMKVTLSKIIFNYKLTTDVKYDDIKLKVDVVLRSADGYMIKLYYRKE